MSVCAMYSQFESVDSNSFALDGRKEGERLEQPLKTINKIFSSSSSPTPLFLSLFSATEKVEHGTVQGIESRGSLR